MAFLLYDPRPQYRLDSGAVCAGGTLYFYDTGTIVPRNVYADADLGTSLGATVELDSAGRTPTSVFLDGAYSVELRDADDVQVWQLDDVTDGSPGGVSVPDPGDGEDGDVLGTDGLAWLFRAIREVPDTTGHSNKVLKAIDDETYGFMPEQTLPEYDADNLPEGIEQSGSSWRIGNRLFQEGNDTAPSNSSGVTTSKAVTFGTAYDSAPKVKITLTGAGGHTPQGAKCGFSVVTSTAGFTVYFYAADEHDNPGWFITNTVPFDWEATGISAPA